MEEEFSECQERDFQMMEVQQEPTHEIYQNYIKASDLKAKTKRTFCNSSLQSANGRNMSKYIIKQFFSLINQSQFQKDHWERLMQIQSDAKDTGNTAHLKQLFGRGATQRQQQMNQKNRDIAQQKIAKHILKQVLTNNSIKDPVNYICTCFCYMYRLNFPQTAQSGVALIRKSK